MTKESQQESNRRSPWGWWPIIIQTVGLTLMALSYTTAMEHRLTMMESSVKTNSAILEELKILNNAQNSRLQLLETNQARILALEEYAYQAKH